MKLTCIECPNGCTLTVTGEGDAMTIIGQRCKRGERYARQEITCPMRTVTTTLRTKGGDRPTLPVRVDGEIPRARMAEVVRALKDVEAVPPVACGDVLVRDILGLGVNIIATDDLKGGGMP